MAGATLAPAAPAEGGSGSAPRTRRSWVPLVLLLPATVSLGFTVGYPLIWLLRTSFSVQLADGVISGQLTSGVYSAVLDSGFYWKVVLTTVELGGIVTGCTLVLTYPLALFLLRTGSRWRGVLIALAVAPMLTSTVVRSYGWLMILNNQGLIDTLLRNLGYHGTPPALDDNFTGTVIGLVEVLMPYAVLAMLSGFGRLDPELERAAASLGASRLQVWRRVTLPLSLPGVLTAGLLVFVLSISAFVTPDILGGGRVFVLATEVYDDATVSLNWPQAAVLSVFILVLFAVVGLIYQRASRLLSRT
jgi:putative spermidine/putrescine transport system permease protein